MLYLCVQFSITIYISDLRLIDPSGQYPVLEVEVALNFFPGDHGTADKYKQFVHKLTKEITLFYYIFH